MSAIEGIVRVMESSREMQGYQTISRPNLDELKFLLELFKEEIKIELREELKSEYL